MLMSYYLEKHEIDTALGCLEAATAEVKNNEWYSTLEDVSRFMEYFKKDGDVNGAEMLCEILKKLKRLDHVAYKLLLEIYVAASRTAPEMRMRIMDDGIEIRIWLQVLITPGGGTAPSTPSWILRRCREEFELFLPPSPDCDEFGESGLRWLSLSGVVIFLPPSPDCSEFGESGLRTKVLSLSGVELFLPPSPDCDEFGESGLRFMVRTKPLAKAYITCYPGPSGSDSESSADSERVGMGKKASTSDSEAVTKLSVAKISSRKVPCSPEGLWVENLGYFVSKSEEIKDSFYCRSIRFGYARQPNAGPGPYNREAFDRKFANSIVAKEHYELKDEYAGLDHAAQDSAVRAAFQLDRRIEWRWPTPDERIYHRPDDGFVLMTRDTFMIHRTMNRGLPHYNPNMSSSAYSDALKGLGKAFKLPKKNVAAGSGSNASAEEGSQSNAVPIPEPKVHVNQSTPEHNVELDIRNEFDNLEDLGPIGEIPGADSGRRRKRLRNLGSKPPRAENFEAGSGSGLLDGYMAGSASLAYNELKGFRIAVADRDSEISRLRDQIIVKDNSLSGLNKHLNEVTIRAENAEKEVSDLKSELAELRRQMSVVRPKAEVIEEFKRSKDYDRALANAGAPEIARCWLVAERHIKTKPEADWDNFVSDFIKAKEDIELGLGEPDPFDGPCPSFLPSSAPES
ncbi:hypothetical protein AgCh_006232 [Apium graveolens]